MKYCWGGSICEKNLNVKVTYVFRVKYKYRNRYHNNYEYPVFYPSRCFLDHAIYHATDIFSLFPSKYKIYIKIYYLILSLVQPIIGLIPQMHGCDEWTSKIKIVFLFIFCIIILLCNKIYFLFLHLDARCSLSRKWCLYSLFLMYNIHAHMHNSFAASEGDVRVGILFSSTIEMHYTSPGKQKTATRRGSNFFFCPRTRGPEMYYNVL